MGQPVSSRPLPSPLADYCYKTRVNVNKFSFAWEIENFSHIPQQTGEAILSDTFSAEDSKDKWRVKIYVWGYNQASKDYVSLFLLLVETERKNVATKFKFSLNRREERSYEMGGQFPNNFTVDGLGWGWPNFIRRSCLMNPISGLLPDDKLTIVCSVAVTGDIVSVASELPRFDSPLGNGVLSAHQTNLAELLSSEQLSDCTIGVGGRQFKAHKAILSAHSPVFSAMFNHNTKESQTGQIDIEDTEPEVMKELLQFLYTGSAPNLKSMADRLLVLADKYQVQPLKLMCEDALGEQLSVENACAVLVQADRLSANRLKAYALQFMIANVKSVSKSEGFKCLAQQYPDLFFEAVQTLANKFKP